MRQSKFKGTYSWNAERGEWIGVIYSSTSEATLVHNIGCERSREAIVEWIKAELRGQPIPDMYDRAKGRFH